MAEPQFEDDDSKSLLCLETFISPTPPTDDQEWCTPDTSVVWVNNHGQVTSLASTKLSTQGTNGKVAQINLLEPKHHNNNNNSINSVRDWINESGINVLKDRQCTQLLKHTLLEGISVTGEKYQILVQKDINSNFQSKCTRETHLIKPVGNDGDSCQRMSGSNGFDRNRVTGSAARGESLHCLSDGSGPPVRPAVTTVAEGMLMGRAGGTGAVAFHDPGTRSIVTGSVGAGPQSNIGDVFRPPQSVGESARYGSAYSSTAASPSISPMYTISPYSAFYSQYPAYTLDRPVGSYSAVLQSMGTQAQSHVQRSPFGNSAGAMGPAAGGVSQYPLLTVNQTSPPTSNKGYASVSPGREQREELPYRREQDIDIHRRHSTTSIVKDETGHHFSVPTGYSESTRASVSSVLRESPNHKRGELSPGNQDVYKAPSGREGSMKYRILRTSDSTPTSICDPTHSAFINTDEPLPKRTKLETSDTDRHIPTETKPDPLPGAPARTFSGDPGSSGAGAELHYPQHFMKGSIIQLANGDIKRVEELETNDFVHSADISNDLKIDSSTVVHIEENPAQGTVVLGFVVGEHKVQVSTEATLEHPFFVFGQGWSSCHPKWTLQRYGLDCHKLSVGDVCISLTHKEVSQHAAEISEQQKQEGGNNVFQKSFKRDFSLRGGEATSGSSSSPSQRNKPLSFGGARPTQSPGVGGFNPHHSRSVTGHSSLVREGGPVKAESAMFLSSNQIPTTTKPQDLSMTSPASTAS